MKAFTLQQANHNEAQMVSSYWLLTLSQILDPSKLTEFAANNFKFDENATKFFNWVEKTLGEKEKLLIMLILAHFSFSHSVFKRLVLQKRKNQGLFGKGLKCANTVRVKPRKDMYGKTRKAG